jgi:hypothetical protein
MSSCNILLPARDDVVEPMEEEEVVLPPRQKPLVIPTHQNVPQIHSCDSANKKEIMFELCMVEMRISI